MPTKPTKSNPPSDKKRKIEGFTLDADGVVRPAKGLELETSRICFSHPLRSSSVTFEAGPRINFNVRLRFSVTDGRFEAQVSVSRSGTDEQIYSQVLPNCRSLGEARGAFDRFFDDAVNEIRSVHDRARRFQESGKIARFE